VVDVFVRSSSNFADLEYIDSAFITMLKRKITGSINQKDMGSSLVFFFLLKEIGSHAPIALPQKERLEHLITFEKLFDSSQEPRRKRWTLKKRRTTSKK
jgi:hypothetical protein